MMDEYGDYTDARDSRLYRFRSNQFAALERFHHADREAAKLQRLFQRRDEIRREKEASFAS